MEQWRPVVGYEALYEVSDAGRVRRTGAAIVTSNGQTRRYGPRFLKIQINKAGYAAVALSRNNVAVKIVVHQLVAEAFIGPRPRGMEVAHWDGRGANAHLGNLRYATPVENNGDKRRHGVQIGRPRT